jgi:hypothetical protein
MYIHDDLSTTFVCDGVFVVFYIIGCVCTVAASVLSGILFPSLSCGGGGFYVSCGSFFAVFSAFIVSN